MVRVFRKEMFLWVLLAVVAVVSLLLAFFVLPDHLVGHKGNIDRLKARNDVRAAAVQAIGGIFLAIGAVLTARTYYLSREGQITERYTRAIDQLGNTELSVRLGGIYALERIARDSAVDHWPVMEVLTAYVREQSRKTRATRKLDLRPPADIEAVLTVLRRRKRSRESEDQRLDLTRADLRGARLEGIHLEHSDLHEARLDEAVLNTAHFEHATLDRAVLDGAHLVDTHLEDALLIGASFKPTSNSRTLVHAYLKNADLTDADLEGADLSKARNAEWQAARTDASTGLPAA